MGPEFYSIASSYPGLQASYGLLSGPAFSLAFALSGLFWGKAADKYNRSKMLALCCIGWSLSSFATGSFNSLAVLALMRFGLGATAAAAEPLMFSMISDTFPKNKQPLATSLLTAGPYLGSALSCLGIIGVGMVGWRGVFNIMGAFGVACGLLQLLTVKEPERCAMEEPGNEYCDVKLDEEQASLIDTIKDLFKNPVAFYSTMGAACRFVNILACDYFFPAYMLMSFPAYKVQFATLSAICIAVCGFASSVSGGMMATKFGPKNPKNYSRIAMIGSALALPCFLVTLLTNNFWYAMIGLFGKYLLGENFWGPNLAMIQ